jgi:hypothetical protein
MKTLALQYCSIFFALFGSLVFDLMLEVCGNLGTDFKEVRKWICIEGLLNSLSFQADWKQIVMSAPITNIFHADGLPTGTFAEMGQDASNNCATEMACMEWLRNVRTRELNHEFFRFSGDEKPLASFIPYRRPSFKISGRTIFGRIF